MVKNDVVIVGGGAAGLMCAIEAGKRGRSVLLLEHNETVGEKIRISGGGRCNFTNLRADHSKYISRNPHFCKSAFARYPSSSFIALVEKHGIAYHEKKLGQLFCDGSSEQIMDMLLKECNAAGVAIQTNTKVSSVHKNGLFTISTPREQIEATSLVIASGGLSIPPLGASKFGYAVAQKFGLKVVPPKPGLVPMTFQRRDREVFGSLSGVSLDVNVKLGRTSFRDHVLFTHRGLSGPAILQISSYWEEGETITLDLLPDREVYEMLRHAHNSRSSLATVLEQVLPNRFARIWCESLGESISINYYSLAELRAIAEGLHAWKIVPSGTEGYAKAEVTVGGIDTDGLSSTTMESRKIPGLYFIGEVVDVTGWLGGYNFQWAWASGWAAGQYA